MNPETFYITTSPDASVAHIDRHCHRLDPAAEVKPIPRNEAEAMGFCQYCRPVYFDGEVSLPAPQRVECPCGNGHAERKRPIFEPLRGGGRRKPSIQWNYRHSGCWIGGTIIVVDGAVYRRIGPLFDPVRYNVGRGYAPLETSTETATAD